MEAEAEEEVEEEQGKVVVKVDGVVERKLDRRGGVGGEG